MIGTVDPAGTVRTVSLRVKALWTVLALAALLAAGCGDDGDDQVDTGAPVATSTGVAPSTAPPPTTTVPTATTATTVDGTTQPGIEEFTAQCREGDAVGCRQLSDATLQEICDEGQTAACQTYLARTGEG